MEEKVARLFWIVIAFVLTIIAASISFNIAGMTGVMLVALGVTNYQIVKYALVRASD